MTILATRLRAGLLFYRSVAPFMLALSGLILGAILLPALHEGWSQGLLPGLLLTKLATAPVGTYRSRCGPANTGFISTSTSRAGSSGPGLRMACLQYLRTWSSVAKYQQEQGEDPVGLIEKELHGLCGTGSRVVSFPLFAEVEQEG